MTYAQNKAKARTRTTQPTLTDQSQARETDINIIVGRFLKTGTAPGPAQEPIHADFSELPNDLRGFIEESRSVKRRRAQLPPQLREMPIEELLALTPDKLTTILTPHDTKPPNQSGDSKDPPVG